MDNVINKKSSMILTIIAVATLLISVIGASYAYFSVASNTETKTQVTATTPNIGTIGTTGSSSISFNLTDEQLSYSNRNTEWHITEGGNVSETSSPITIATMAASTVGESISYNCNGTINITLSGGEDSIKGVLAEGSLFVKLGKGSNNISELDETVINLSSTNSAITRNFEYTINKSESASLTADVYFKNTEGIQDDLADKSINLNITVSTDSCEISS